MTLVRVVCCWWIKYEETDYNYEKYLGPDWRHQLSKRTKRIGCIVTNHVHLLDWVPFLGRTFYCTFVMRKEIENIPLMGAATKSMQCFPTDRGASD